MKRKIGVVIVTAALFFTGCGSVDISAEQSNDNFTQNVDYPVIGNSLVCVEYGENYEIYVDKDTNIMYLFVHQSYNSGLAVMLNADGTPRLWTGTKALE